FAREDYSTIAQHVLLAGRPCRWAMCGVINGQGRLNCFELLDGLGVADPGNPTTRDRPPPPIGRRVTSRVEVRRDGVRALIDGEVVTEYRGDPARLTVPTFLLPRDPAQLAITVGGAPLHLYTATVTEVTGRGTRTRPAAPAPNPVAIDLLARVNPARDAVSGQWEWRGADLVGTGLGPDGKGFSAVLKLLYT